MPQAKRGHQRFHAAFSSTASNATRITPVFHAHREGVHLHADFRLNNIARCPGKPYKHAAGIRRCCRTRSRRRAGRRDADRHFSQARKRSPRLKIAISSSPTRTARPSRSGTFSTSGYLNPSFHCTLPPIASICTNCVGLTGGLALQPRVARQRLRFLQPLEQFLLARRRGVHRFLTEPFDADAFHEIVGALQVIGLFRGNTGRKIMAASMASSVVFHRHQQIRLAYRFSAAPPTNHLPASLLPDQSDVLYRGLRTVCADSPSPPTSSCAACNRFSSRFSQLNAGGDGVLHAEAAELRAHARLHHAQALAVCLPRWHAKIRPDLRKDPPSARPVNRCVASR